MEFILLAGVAAIFVVMVVLHNVKRESRRASSQSSVSPEDQIRPASKVKTHRRDFDRSEANKGYQEVKVERVIDGDTVIVSRSFRKIRIRLDSIDCPEDGQHWGDIAKYGLIKMIGGRRVFLEEHGEDCHGRTVATIFVQHGSKWINVNERMVTLGHAWVMRRYYDHLPKDRQNKLNSLERWAKTKKVGLWKTPNPVPPWRWRNGS